MAWVALYSDLLECVAMWVLCINCGIGCKLPVARRHLTLGSLYVGLFYHLPAHCGAIVKTLGFRSHTP